ncbi:MAG: oligosaccharide flippase family protein [Bacteroidales bacterium]|nr:oligosaccharide flippase family protein [Bacteroidales bacterium]
MATDYFPRLSAVQNNDEVKKLVNQQVDSALLIVSPLLILLVVMMPVVVRILYTPAFVPVVMFTTLTVLGIPFGEKLFPGNGYVYLAKGDGKTVSHSGSNYGSCNSDNESAIILFLRLEWFGSIIHSHLHVRCYYFIYCIKTQI